MDSAAFKKYRKQLQKTQREMAHLLGTSLKAIHSYEQGWRKIPTHVERQVLFLIASQRGLISGGAPCWEKKNCPPERRDRCPAWEFNTGELCWFINGTVCDGTVQRDWKQKMRLCKTCEVFTPLR